MDSEEIKQKEIEYAKELSKSMLAWEREKQELLPIILKRKGLDMIISNIPAIIILTRFKEMCSPENIPYCELYRNKKKCHEHLEELNCGLCNCPNYDAKHIGQQEEKTLVGKCNIKSKKGYYHFSKSYPRVGVWSCEECQVHHSERFMEKYLKKTLPE